MAGISFNDYFVKELSYKRNENFDPKNGKLVAPLDANFGYNINEGKAYVDFKLTLGNLTDLRSGFEVKVNVVGEFSYNEEESDGISFDDFIKENAIAMLYSYVRPMVSDIITRSNEFPNYILPVINVRRLIENHRKNKND